MVLARGLRPAFRQGDCRQGYVRETPPRLQGSRLTAWELRQDGIPATLVADAAAAALMRGGDVDWVIVGADGRAWLLVRGAEGGGLEAGYD